MICVTGDTHGDFSRFSHKAARRLKKGDYLIICGDFGFLWKGTAQEKRLLKTLGKKPYYTLFVDGCHENFDLLSQYEEMDWNGGRVHQISGRLYHLQRGYIYRLDNRRIFTFGGGTSQDMEFYRESSAWWQEEAPTGEEIDRGRACVAAAGYEVDYIVTHEPPASLADFLGPRGEQQLSEMSAWFDQLKTACKYKKWFFGKCHMNKVIPPQFHAIFDDVAVIP